MWSFDHIDHQRLMELIERRVGDPRILRLIQKWLQAGVSEEGQWSETQVGTPQGAVISPLLANIYLHSVRDQWVMEWRKPYACGDVDIVRYADDFVLGFQYQKEAGRLLELLGKRLREYGLELHEDKTRLMQFGRYAAEDRKREGKAKPETFHFLGCTHICGRIWKSGRFTVKRKTMRKRMTAKLHDMAAKLRRRRHEPIVTVGTWLHQVLNGYYNYHAVPGNLRSLWVFRNQVAQHWWRVLRRRSQKARQRWADFAPLIPQFLPVPTVRHPYPSERFYAKHPR